MMGLPLLMEGMAWAGMQGVGGLFNQTPFDIRTSNYEGQMMEKLTPEQRAQVYKNREGIEGLISGGNKEQSPYNATISGIGRVAIVNAEHKSISAQANTYLADIAASIKKGSAMVVSGGGYSVPGSVGYLAAGEEGEYGVVGGKRKLIKATKGKKGALAGVEFGGGKVSVGGAFFKPGYAVGEGGMPSREGVLNLFGGATTFKAGTKVGGETVASDFSDEHSAIMDWFASHGGDAALDKAYGEWSKGSMSGSFTDYLKSAYKYTPRTAGTINPMSKKYGGMKDKDYNAWMGTGDFYEHTKAYANLYGPSGTITRQQEYLSTVDRNKSYDAGKRRGLNTGYMVSDSGVTDARESTPKRPKRSKTAKIS
jgi:hypothetical protein